jgi:hypothetical protein
VYVYKRINTNFAVYTELTELHTPQTHPTYLHSLIVSSRSFRRNKWIKFEGDKCAAARNPIRSLPHVSLLYYRLSYPTPNIYCAIFRYKDIACLRTAAHAQIEMFPVHPVKLAYNYSAWILYILRIQNSWLCCLRSRIDAFRVFVKILDPPLNNQNSLVLPGGANQTSLTYMYNLPICERTWMSWTIYFGHWVRSTEIDCVIEWKQQRYRRLERSQVLSEWIHKFCVVRPFSIV